MLNASARPLIVCGGGVINADAAELLVEFAELVNVPVVPTLMGWGVLADDHPLQAGMVGLQTSHRYGNATCWPRTSCWASATAGPIATPAASTSTPRAASSCTWTSSPRRSAACSAGPRHRLRRQAALAQFVEVAREMKMAGRLACRKAWVAEVQQRRRTLHRKSDFDNVPIKPQRVYREMNRYFPRDVRYVSTIGLSQIAAAQFLSVNQPRHWINCGQAGPLGWTIPAAIGVKVASPDSDVVAISGDYDFQFMIEELAVAAQFNVPYIHVVVNNSYLGLIPPQRNFDMDYCVQLAFDNINAPELNGYGVDHVKVVEGLAARRCACSSPGHRARFRAGPQADGRVLGAGGGGGDPERVTNIAMGTEIDNINEFEPVEDRAEDDDILNEEAETA